MIFSKIKTDVGFYSQRLLFGVLKIARTHSAQQSGNKGGKKLFPNIILFFCCKMVHKEICKGGQRLLLLYIYIQRFV